MCPGKIALVTGIDRALLTRQHLQDRQVYTINPDGSALVKLTQASDSDESPTWSPDGKSIAFVTDRNGNRLITIMNADGSARREISPPSGQAWGEEIIWSPDSKKIGFRGYANAFDLYTANADGLGLKRLTNRASDKQTAHIPLNWTEDGKQIVFLSIPTEPDSKTSNGWRVFSMNEDGSNLREILSLQKDLGFKKGQGLTFNLSPDGKYAATDGDAVYLIERSATHKKKVIYSSGNFGNVGGLMWSPNGQKLFIHPIHDENFQGFIILDYKTGITTFFNQPDFYPDFRKLQSISPMSWSPNGKTILGILPKALAFLDVDDFSHPEKIRKIDINQGIQLYSAVWQWIPCAK